MVDYVTRFGPQDIVEIRAIRDGDVQREWYPIANIPGIVPALQSMNERGWNIYYGVNPRLDRSNDVPAVVAFHVDIDKDAAPCFAGQAAQENSGAEANIPAPSLVVDSGHGRHLYWYLRKPVKVTPENRAQLAGVNRGLARTLGGDLKCVDISRILRVPGFTNHKPPSAVVEIVEHGPSRRYELTDFASFSQPVKRTAITVQRRNVDGDLNTRFDAARKADPQLRRAWRGEIGDGSSDSRYYAVQSLVRAGFNDAEIVALVTSRRWYNHKVKRMKDPEMVEADVLRILGQLRGIVV